MDRSIALVVNDRYRHYFNNLEKVFVKRGVQLSHFDVDSFCRLDDLSLVDGVLTIHSLDNKLLTKLAGLKNRTLTVTLQDGLIEYAHCCLKESTSHRYRPIVTDFLLTFGERPKKIALSRCQDANVIATGSPRFDEYSQYQDKSVEIGSPVLMTTANTPWFDSRSKKEFIKLFIEILGTLTELHIDFKLRLPDKVKKELMFKSPLAFNRILRSRYLKGLGNPEIPLIDDVLSSSAVITTPSTVALEAMILNRPVAIIRTGAFPMYLESAFELAGTDSIVPVLSGLTERHVDFDNRMAFQQIIKEENVMADGRASERVANFILNAMS